VKNGVNSLRSSTSNLSLRPATSETELNDAARQRMKDLEARITQMQVEYEARAGLIAAESSAQSFARVSYQSAQPANASRVYAAPPPPHGFGSDAEGSAAHGHDSGAQFTPSPAYPQYQRPSFGGNGSPLPPSGNDSRSPSYAAQAEAWDDDNLGLKGRYWRADGTTYARDLPTLDGERTPTSTPAPFSRLRPWEERDDPTNDPTPEKSLFEKYNESLQEQHNKPKESLITRKLLRENSALKSPEAYTQPFCDFLTENPTVWHAVSYFETKLEKAGFKKVCCLQLDCGHH